MVPSAAIDCGAGTVEYLHIRCRFVGRVAKPSAHTTHEHAWNGPANSDVAKTTAKSSREQFLPFCNDLIECMNRAAVWHLQ